MFTGKLWIDMRHQHHLSLVFVYLSLKTKATLNTESLLKQIPLLSIINQSETTKDPMLSTRHKPITVKFNSAFLVVTSVLSNFYQTTSVEEILKHYMYMLHSTTN